MSFVLVVSCFLVLSMVGLGMIYIVKGVQGKRTKTFLGMNIITLFSILIAFTVLVGGGKVLAAGETSQAAIEGNGLGFIAAALATGLATIGAGIAVAVASSAALGAISEDSKLLGKTLIFVGLAEGIAIYGLIVSILILGKL